MVQVPEQVEGHRLGGHEVARRAPDVDAGGRPSDPFLERGASLRGQEVQPRRRGLVVQVKGLRVVAAGKGQRLLALDGDAAQLDGRLGARF